VSYNSFVIWIFDTA